MALAAACLLRCLPRDARRLAFARALPALERVGRGSERGVWITSGSGGEETRWFVGSTNRICVEYVIVWRNGRART